MSKIGSVPAGSWGPYPERPFGRTIVRDSSGNIITFIKEGDSSVRPVISSDDGSSWTMGDTTFATYINRQYDDMPGLEIYGDDTVAFMGADDGSNDNFNYIEFTIDTAGTVSVLVDEITNTNESTNLSDGFHLAIDSTGQIYAAMQPANKIMGTYYEFIEVWVRSGGSWTFLGDIGYSTQSEYVAKEAHIDGNDDFHILYTQGTGSGDARWNKWDSSAGSFVGEEIITSDRADSMIIDSSNEPAVTASKRVWVRSSGTWSSDAFTLQGVGSSSITWGADRAYVVYDSSGNIYQNNASLGSFNVDNESPIIETPIEYRMPTVRWSYLSDNDPSPDVVDILYFDEEQDILYYDSLSTTTETGPGSVLRTTSSGVIKTQDTGVLRTQ